MEHASVPTDKVNRLDMEPTHGSLQTVTFHQKGFTITMLTIKPVPFVFNSIAPILQSSIVKGQQLRSAIRMRGGTPDPNNDSKHNTIPYLTNIKFIYNGLPCIDFQERVMDPLNNGLGSMNVKGATLLQTALEQDPGGLRGNPSNLFANPQTMDEHNQRVIKLYSCIMNYIHPTCEMYFYFARFFPGEGITIYSIIRATGPLITPQRIVDARADAWEAVWSPRLLLVESTISFTRNSKCGSI